MHAGAAVLQRPRFRQLLAAAHSGEQRAFAQHSAAVAALNHLAWEAIHTGPWHAVPQSWRTTYALAALLTCAVEMEERSCASAEHTMPVHTQAADARVAPGAECASGNGAAHDAIRQRAGTDAQAAIKRLDVALMVGGPALAPQLHRAIALLATHCGSAHPCGHRRARSGQRCNDAAAARSAKRAPDDALNRSGAAGEGAAGCCSQRHASGTAPDGLAEAAAAATAAQGRVNVLETIQAIDSPGIAQFEQNFFGPGKPALLEGLLDAWPARTRHGSAAVQSSVLKDVVTVRAEQRHCLNCMLACGKANGVCCAHVIV